MPPRVTVSQKDGSSKPIEDPYHLILIVYYIRMLQSACSYRVRIQVKILWE